MVACHPLDALGMTSPIRGEAKRGLPPTQAAGSETCYPDPAGIPLDPPPHNRRQYSSPPPGQMAGACCRVQIQSSLTSGGYR